MPAPWVSSRESRHSGKIYHTVSVYINMDENTEQMRFVVFKGAVYLRAEDVANYIMALGGSEETDVRNRLKQAAQCVRQVRQ